MCGVVGLIGAAEAAKEAFLGLTTLQHRGQDAAGILTYDADGFHSVKNVGLVDSVFTRDNTSTLSGNMAIGHVRYSTIGKGDLNDVQPFLLSYPFGLGLVHNGNIVNCSTLAKELKAEARRHLLSQSDTEVVLHMLADALSRTPGAQPGVDLDFEHICSAVGSIFKRANGSYSIISLIADRGLVAFRDPFGIRPLILGKRDGAYMLASESVALSFLRYEIVRDVEPGEVIFIDSNGKLHSRVIDKREKRSCMFEWVYFSSPESVIDSVPVYRSRINLGKNLAALLAEKIRAENIEADIIVPIPETSRIAAIALSEELKIPYRELLIKNRYIKRTFILDSQEKRQKAVNLKLSPVRSEMNGKRIILVDDSIVRGTTSRKIVELVRQAGASKVYLVSTCPAIKYPCYYGIDFPCTSELIASGRDLKEVEKDLDVDAVVYQKISGLKKSIEGFTPCVACLDGKYPTDVSAAESFSSARAKDRRSKK